MGNRLALFLLVPALVAIAPSQQPREKFVKYMGEKGWIYVRNFEELNSTQTGEILIKGAGRPMQIQDTGNGITIIGNQIDVILVQGPTETFLKKATVSEKAHVVFDSKLKYKTALEMVASGRPVPEKPEEIALATADSETMVYTREGKIGVLTMPTQTTLTMNSKGASNTGKPFTQKLDMVGNSARFDIEISPATQFVQQQFAPQRARMEGAVKIHFVRDDLGAAQATAPAARPGLTDITGTTDLVELDFTVAEPTLTFTGNVHVQGQAKGMPGEVSGTKGTLVFNRSFEIMSYQFLGEPTTTRVKVTKDGGR